MGKTWVKAVENTQKAVSTLNLPSAAIAIRKKQTMVRRRKMSEVTTKVVAAKQQWMCSMCKVMLSSAFQIDHILPLSDGGSENVVNLQALCASCHSQKTQAESLARTALKRQERLEYRAKYERAVRREETVRRQEQTHISGTVKCLDCKERSYPVFAHKCREVAARVDARLGVKNHKHKQVADLSDLFGQFYFTGSNSG